MATAPSCWLLMLEGAAGLEGQEQPLPRPASEHRESWGWLGREDQAGASACQRHFPSLADLLGTMEVATAVA